MDSPPARILDYDLEIDDNLEKFLRISDQPTTGTVAAPDYNLILWLLLEKSFKEYNDYVPKDSIDSDEKEEVEHDAVDSKKVNHSCGDRARKFDKAELALAKEYAEQILKGEGVKVPFSKLTQGEKDSLFQQFIASSKLLLPDSFNGTRSTLELFQALRKKSKYREEFRVNSLIGKGSYGEVFAVELKKKTPGDFDECYNTFAIKKMPNLSLEKIDDIKMIINESSILKSLSGHPGIVKYYDSWLALEPSSENTQGFLPRSSGDSFIFYLQMEFCGETLHQWKTKLSDRKEKPNEKQCIAILEQISVAMDWIHGNNVLHLDINPKNIFWKDSNYASIKIGDFGLAVEGSSLSNRRGTPPYCAPEGIMTSKSDIYSVGVTIFEIAEAIQTRVELASRLEKLNISTGMEALDGVIPKLLSKTPDERLTSGEIVSSIVRFQR